MAAHSPQFIVNDHGKRTAVVLPIRKYERMMTDLHDLAVVAERKEEKAIGLAEMKERLKRDGLL